MKRKIALKELIVTSFVTGKELKGGVQGVTRFSGCQGAHCENPSDSFCICDKRIPSFNPF